MKLSKNKKPALRGFVWIDYNEFDPLSYAGVMLRISVKSPRGTTIDDEFFYGDGGVHYCFASGNPIVDFALATDKMQTLGVRRKDMSYSSACEDFVSDGINFTYKDAIKPGSKVSANECTSKHYLTMRYTTPEERVFHLESIFKVIAEFEAQGEFESAEQFRTSLAGQIAQAIAIDGKVTQKGELKSVNINADVPHR